MDSRFLLHANQLRQKFFFRDRKGGTPVRSALLLKALHF
jgi:hypothetical protein